MLRIDRYLKTTLIAAASAALILTGCTGNDAAPAEEAAPAEQVEETLPADAESETPEAAPETEADAEPAAEPDDSADKATDEASGLPEYLTGDFTENTENNAVETEADATNALEGDAISLTAKAEAAGIGETIGVSSASDGYELSVQSVELTDERNQYAETDPKKVVKVTYTFCSTGKNEIMAGPFCFRLVNDKGLAYNAYPLDSTAVPEAEIMPSSGETITAAIAFEVNDDSSSVRLIFDDIPLGTGVEYYFDAEI